MLHSTMADPRDMRRHQIRTNSQRNAVLKAVVTLDEASDEPWNKTDVSLIAALTRRRLCNRAEQGWLIEAFLHELITAGHVTQDPETMKYRLNDAGRGYCKAFIDAF